MNWDVAEDTNFLQELAASNMKWTHFALRVGEHRQSLPTPEPLCAAFPALDWILDSMGGSRISHASHNGDSDNAHEDIVDQAQGQGDSHADDNEIVHQEPTRLKHHVNFQGQWFHKKSNTPPSVSLFAAVTASGQQPVCDRISRKAVLKA